MRAVALWLALLAAPYWETKPPPEWSEEQLLRLLTASPWAQGIEKLGKTAFLATALPVREAERELARRRKAKGAEPPDPEFSDFLAEDHGRHIVLAISYPDIRPLSDAAEARRMVEESILKIGRKKYKMTGHFPPTPSDPYLRMAFPRELAPGDKSLVFELYLPGVGGTYGQVEFRLKELLYQGKPEL
jgi:hypothetical protein